MKKASKKRQKKTSTQEYMDLLKKLPKNPLPPAHHEWDTQGDYFVKFSLFKDTQSIASPNTSLIQER